MPSLLIVFRNSAPWILLIVLHLSLNAELLHRLPLAQPAPYHYFYDHDSSSGTSTWSGALEYDGYGITYDGHSGTDFTSDGPTQVDGWDIYATAGGWITEKADGIADTAYYDENNKNGNLVRLYHDNGQQTVYVHMKNGSVTTKGVGEWVKAGEYLGKIGRSGYAVGEHLHYEFKEYNYQTDEWHSIDPFDGFKRPFGGGHTWNYTNGYAISTSNKVNPYKIEKGADIIVVGLGSYGLSGRLSASGSSSIISSHYEDDEGVIIDGPIYSLNYLRWQVEWQSGVTSWVAGRWLRKTQIDMQTVDIDSIDMSRHTVRAGESFFVTYTINSSFDSSDYILGCSFYKNGELQFYDSDNDIILELQAGTNDYVREFKIPEGQDISYYDGSFEVWRDDDGDGAINGDDDTKVDDFILYDILSIIGYGTGGGQLPAEPFLSITDYSIDDNDGGESWGNDDGEVSAGEAVEVRLELTNFGGESTDNVKARILDISPSDIYYSDTISFRRLSSNETDIGSGDFDIEPLYGSTASEITLVVEIECDDGIFIEQLTIPLVPLLDTDKPEITSIFFEGGEEHQVGSDPRLSFSVRDLSGIVAVEFWRGIIGPDNTTRWNRMFVYPIARTQELSSSYKPDNSQVGHYQYGLVFRDAQDNFQDSAQDLILLPMDNSELPSPAVEVTNKVSISWPSNWSGFIVEESSDLIEWVPSTPSAVSIGSDWKAEFDKDGPSKFYRLRLN